MEPDAHIFRLRVTALRNRQSFQKREKILEHNERRKGQLNLMLFETQAKLADHEAGRSLLEDEVSLTRVA